MTLEMRQRLLQHHPKRLLHQWKMLDPVPAPSPIVQVIQLTINVHVQEFLKKFHIMKIEYYQS